MSNHPLAFGLEDGDYTSKKQGAYELKIAEFLFSKYNIAHRKREVVRRGETLTLADFDTVVGGFPIFLVADSMEWLQKDCSVASLFSKFSTRKPVKRYWELREELAGEYEENFGLVFPWTGISRGLILHDCVVDIDITVPLKKPCVRMVWSMTETKLKRTGCEYLTLEPFEQFLDTVMKDWEPGE